MLDIFSTISSAYRIQSSTPRESFQSPQRTEGLEWTALKFRIFDGESRYFYHDMMDIYMFLCGCLE